MSRDLTASALSALTDADVRIALFLEGEFDSGVTRLWTGAGNIEWNGQTWVGMMTDSGALVGIGDIEESDNIQAAGTTVSLSGVLPELVSLAISDARQGLPGRLWLGLLDENMAIIDDPILIFTGRLDVPEIIDGSGTCVMQISYENRLIDLQRPREYRYTHEAQKALYSGDTGLSYVTSIQDKDFTWGR